MLARQTVTHGHRLRCVQTDEIPEEKSSEAGGEHVIPAVDTEATRVPPTWVPVAAEAGKAHSLYLPSRRACPRRARRELGVGESPTLTSTKPTCQSLATTNDCALPEVQALFCRRRHQPRRAPLAKIRPGRPAPSEGCRSARRPLRRRDPRQRNMLWIISLFIAATKTCPIRSTMFRFRDVASRASTAIAGEGSGISEVFSLSWHRIVIAN